MVANEHVWIADRQTPESRENWKAMLETSAKVIKGDMKWPVE
ncbi:hypothetical protein PY32053_03932 (plasmid) [Paracoccus yeei]|uniref:Uncharacterized protein n=1 Tax=Paracoccus yeei TaxID=147645 RepID=A0A386URZ5_9RHOB|nr:hypothetical protein [Paracoccus yeei]AYF03473.1 hypothetical protein PY32053_03932 [Paracoccus yeei]